MLKTSKEKRNEYMRDYRKKNLASLRGVAKSYRKKYQKTLKGKVTRQKEKYKYNSSRRMIPFNLSNDQIREALLSNCHYCNMPQSMGIDRVDSGKGYFLENVVPCCKNCNFMKGTMSYEDFISQIKKIYNNFS